VTLANNKQELLVYILSLVTSVYVYYFSHYHLWKSNPRVENSWHENRLWCQIYTQGHSRSLILQSITSRQRIAYRHNAVLILKVSEEVAT